MNLFYFYYPIYNTNIGFQTQKKELMNINQSWFNFIVEQKKRNDHRPPLFQKKLKLIVSFAFFFYNSLDLCKTQDHDIFLPHYFKY